MDGLVFGPGALIAVGLYLVSMIGVGWIARQKRRSNSMADFYLAGRSMGLAVLFPDAVRYPIQWQHALWLHRQDLPHRL